MDHKSLLENPDPDYTMKRDQKCYLAYDNAHGGHTATGRIIRQNVDSEGSYHYKLQYMDPTNSLNMVEITVPVPYVFTSLNDIPKARLHDNSLQLKNISDACSTPLGLVMFLLSKTQLPSDEEAVVIDRAKRLALYGDGYVRYKT